MAYLRLESLLPSTAGLLVTSDIHFGFLHVPNALFCGLLLLPMTIAIGMTYPLAVRILARDADEAAPASARVYAWNTVGAIVGSLAAGFLLIPELKYEGAIRVAVCASAALGVRGRVDPAAREPRGRHRDELCWRSPAAYSSSRSRR